MISSILLIVSGSLRPAEPASPFLLLRIFRLVDDNVPAGTFIFIFFRLAAAEPPPTLFLFSRLVFTRRGIKVSIAGEQTAVVRIAVGNYFSRFLSRCVEHHYVVEAVLRLEHVLSVKLVLLLLLHLPFLFLR